MNSNNPRRIQKKLSRFREIFFREKYRFDQGNAFLVFINFSLLVITLINISDGNHMLVPYFIIGGLLTTWFLGYFLDRFVRVQDIQEKVVLQRSPIWRDVFIKHDEHERSLEESLARLERLEKRLESFENRMEKLEVSFEKTFKDNQR